MTKYKNTIQPTIKKADAHQDKPLQKYMSNITSIEPSEQIALDNFEERSIHESSSDTPFGATEEIETLKQSREQRIMKSSDFIRFATPNIGKNEPLTKDLSGGSLTADPQSLTVSKTGIDQATVTYDNLSYRRSGAMLSKTAIAVV